MAIVMPFLTKSERNPAALRCQGALPSLHQGPFRRPLRPPPSIARKVAELPTVEPGEPDGLDEVNSPLSQFALGHKGYGLAESIGDCGLCEPGGQPGGSKAFQEPSIGRRVQGYLFGHASNACPWSRNSP